MRKRTLAIASVSLAALTALSLSGCGVTVDFTVDVPARQVTAKSTTYYTKEEVASLEGLDSELSIDRTETRDGKTYYCDDSTVTRKGSKALAKSSEYLDGDKYIRYDYDGEWSPDAMKSMYATLDFFEWKMTFNRTPVATNGALSGNTVTYKGYPGPIAYTAFTEASAKCKKIKPSVKPGKTRKKTVSFSTRGIVTQMKVNGKVYYPDVKRKCGKLLRDYVKFGKKGTYKVQVKLLGGYKKTFKYRYVK